MSLRGDLLGNISLATIICLAFIILYISLLIKTIYFNSIMGRKKGIFAYSLATILMMLIAAISMYTEFRMLEYEYQYSYVNKNDKSGIIAKESKILAEKEKETVKGNVNNKSEVTDNKSKIEVENINRNQYIGEKENESIKENINNKSEVNDNKSKIEAENSSENQYIDENGKELIKGTIDKETGEKMYHIPGSIYYDMVKMEDTSKFFKSQKEARKAGYTTKCIICEMYSNKNNY